MEDTQTKEMLTRCGKLVAKGLQNEEDGPKRGNLASLTLLTIFCLIESGSGVRASSKSWTCGAFPVYPVAFEVLLFRKAV